jgi:hypothetical protein
MDLENKKLGQIYESVNAIVDVLWKEKAPSSPPPKGGLASGKLSSGYNTYFMLRGLGMWRWK